MQIIQIYNFIGYDWPDNYDDGYSHIEYLKNKDGGFNFDKADVQRTIINDVYEFLKEFGDDYELANIPTLDVVRDKIIKKEEFSLEKETPYVSVSFEDDAIKILCNIMGCQVKRDYTVKEIPDDNVRYMAVEEIYAPYKGACTIERTYEMPNKNYEDAVRALELIPDKREGYNTGKYIEIINSDMLSDEHFNSWLENNLKIAEAMKNNPDMEFTV